MAQFKDALSNLSPIAFDDLPPKDELPQFLKTLFTHAEFILNSVPVQPADHSGSFTPAPANSANAAEDTFCDPTKVPLPDYERDPSAVKAWGKPIKLAAKENPLGVQVFKMAAHDRHGAWFARRSVHQGLGFKKWKKAASNEFSESLKTQEGPGSGAVRGVGADRRVEKLQASDESIIEVWQTSSAFPGPVTPRESLTLLAWSTDALSENSRAADTKKAPRHLIVVSRPTRHFDAPDRPNLVKMEYESVEMIREIPLEDNEDAETNPIEWLMVTRSDPGGGIPRFMVERGTPGSIVADVGKFLNWACSKGEVDFETEGEADIEAIVQEHNKKVDMVEEKRASETEDGQTTSTASAKPLTSESHISAQYNDGLVSKFTEAVASTASDYLPYFQQQSTYAAAAGKDNSDTSSDISEDSNGTFRSALHDQTITPLSLHPPPNELSNDSSASLEKLSSDLVDKRNNSRELDRLLQKRTELDVRAEKEREAFAQKAVQASEREEKERNKMMDRHEKQRKKQEERYQREIAKLDARRIKEEQKEGERRKKAEQKDEMKRLKSELAEWKNKCQIAEKEAELLRQQIERLQRENTAIVARLPEGEVKSILHQTSSGKSRPSSLHSGSAKSGVS